MRTKEINNLYWFCQVVEYGGFVAASQQNKASAPTLSRAIAALETACGEKLLHRNAKQFRLTAAGKDYYRRFSPLFKAVDNQWLDVNNAQAELAGDIHVSCTVPFAEAFLQYRAIKFMQNHDKINIIVHYAHDTSRFIAEDIDIAIVNTAVKEPYLVQRKLFEVPVGFAAAPSYINKHGYPIKANELSKHSLLLSNSTATPFWHVEQDGVQHQIPLKPKYQINNFNLIHDAAIAGLGICLMPMPLLQGLEKAGKVVHLLKDATCPNNKTYVVRSDKNLTSARTLTFYDSLFSGNPIANGKDSFFEKQVIDSN